MLSPQQVTPTGFQQPVCEGAPLPDIEVLPNIGMYGSSTLNAAGNFEVVIPFYISVGIINRGQCATGRFTIKVEMRVQAQGVDKVVQLGPKGVASLQPCRSRSCRDTGERKSVRFEFTPEYNHAIYQFTVEADASHSINEFNEENNEVLYDMRINKY